MPNYRFKDLTGQVFGLLTVVSLSPERAPGSMAARWNCVCACGNVKIQTGTELTGGRIDHCGCLTKERLSARSTLDITGLRVGKLVVLARTSRTSNTYWRCQCDCGNEHVARVEHLVRGAPVSCGCWNPKKFTREEWEHRLWTHIDKNGPVPPHRPELGPCWIWTGSTFESGYGQISFEGKNVPAHRATFLVVHGRWPTPQGLHHCDNPPCVKVIDDEHGPSHIFEGTNADNHADMVAKGRHGQMKKTHCKYGHPFDEANTLTAPGRRRCRLCMKMYAVNAAAQKGASTR